MCTTHTSWAQTLIFSVAALYPLSSASGRWLTHACNLFPLLLHATSSWFWLVLRCSLCTTDSFLSSLSLRFIFLPEFYIPFKGNFCDLWVSLTQPSRKRVGFRGVNSESKCCICFDTMRFSEFFFTLCSTWWVTCSVIVLCHQMASSHVCEVSCYVGEVHATALNASHNLKVVIMDL